jgi:UDP-GlcNAc:undecaprenyl-phosphate GlcNAc-1-phosphate transferase
MIILILFLTVLYIDYKFKLFNFFNHSLNKHDIHKNFVSRFGGIYLVIFFIFSLFYFKLNDTSFCIFLFPFLFISLLTIIEDFKYHINPFIRLIILFIAAIFSLNMMPSFPYINVPIVGDILNNHYILMLLFLSISILAITNAFNMIDGTNGLLSATSLSIILSIIFIVKDLDQNLFKIFTIILILGSIIFICNYFLRFIFHGDTGSYFYGIIISLGLIYIFSISHNLYSWSAVILVFYPFLELITSICRRKIKKLNATDPDLFHLHTLVYKYLLLKKSYKPETANNYVVIFLTPLWLLPPILFILSIHNIHFVYLSLFNIFVIYYLYYYFFNAKAKTND